MAGQPGGTGDAQKDSGAANPHGPGMRHDPRKWNAAETAEQRNGPAGRLEERAADFPGLNPELASLQGDAGRWLDMAARSDAETAAEPGAPEMRPRGGRQADEPASPGRTVSVAGMAAGLPALAIAVASLFVWPLPLGLAAAALGLFGFREGARGLGAWAIIIGLAAALSQFVLIPILAAWS